MEPIRFEWDQAKSLSNQRKHALSFEEAAEVFRDPLQVSIQDRVENGEERWQTFGIVRGVLLVLLVMVAHTVREESQAATVIRIISARRADRKERRFYEDQNG